MYSAIATDLDHTFMHDGMTIAALNKQMVQRAASQGVHFVVASGRQAAPIKQVMTKVGVHGAKVCLNGSYVEDADGRVLVASQMATDAMPALFEAAQAAGANMMLYRAAGVFRYDCTNSPLWKMAFLLHGRGENYLFRTEARMWRLLQRDAVYKVGFNHKDHAVLERLRERLADRDYSMVWASPNFLELTNPGVNKLSGLQALAAAWGLSVADFVAYGDYENDLAMLAGVGHGVAMSNAIPAVAAVADVVVDNHDNAGVGRSLQTLMAAK